MSFYEILCNERPQIRKSPHNRRPSPTEGNLKITVKLMTFVWFTRVSSTPNDRSKVTEVWYFQNKRKNFGLIDSL
jgi:hypothetical protein